MRNRVIKLSLLAAVLVICAGTADAQAKRTAKKRPASTKKTTTKSTGKPTATVAGMLVAEVRSRTREGSSASQLHVSF